MRVTLINWPANIEDVLDLIWQVSKTDSELSPVRQFDDTLLQTLLNENVPVLRNFYFTFLIEDMSIAFREQLVRSQYDHYWIQSGRITDWSKADRESGVYESVYLSELEDEIHHNLNRFFEECQAAGIRPEDYRHMVPVGSYHRGIWTANLESLMTRFRKRSCWVAQSKYWIPILAQVQEQILKDCGITLPMIPPCNRDPNKCTIKATMFDRLNGDDPLPVCPLVDESLAREQACERTEQYFQLWGME